MDMIKKISFIRNYVKSIYQKGQQFCEHKNAILFQNASLTEDVIQISKKSKVSVLANNPNILNRKYNSGIEDIRLKSFDTEYRAYDFVERNCSFPNEYICVDLGGKRRLKPHIYLNMVEVRPEFARQGVYANAIRELRNEALSKKECGGRIILDARKMNDYTETQISSPAIAHWKCGFRFVNEENNIIMQKVLLGKLPPESAPEGLMYMQV